MRKLTLFLISGLALVFASSASAWPTLGCYVDTPAFDLPTAGSCSGPGGPSNTATFSVMNVAWDPAKWSVHWIEGCAAQSWNWCMVNISPGQCVTRSARITNLVTGKKYLRSATACRGWPDF